MMNRRFRVAILLIMVFLCAYPFLYAQDRTLQELLPDISESDIFELKTKGEISRFFGKGETLSLIPRHRYAGSVNSDIDRLEPTLGVESLYLYAPQASLQRKKDKELLFYNILHALSTLSGLQYYSPSRKTMRTFFKESYVIDNPKDKRPIPDKVFSSIPETYVLHMFQEDLTFGKNVSEVSYHHVESMLGIRIRNLTTMYYFIFPLIQPDMLRTYLLVFPVEDKLLIYGTICARTGSFFGIEQSRRDSFYNRMDAMYGWFIQKLETSLLP